MAKDIFTGTDDEIQCTDKTRLVKQTLARFTEGFRLVETGIVTQAIATTVAGSPMLLLLNPSGGPAATPEMVLAEGQLSNRDLLNHLAGVVVVSACPSGLANHLAVADDWAFGYHVVPTLLIAPMHDLSTVHADLLAACNVEDPSELFQFGPDQAHHPTRVYRRYVRHLALAGGPFHVHPSESLLNLYHESFLDRNWAANHRGVGVL